MEMNASPVEQPEEKQQNQVNEGARLIRNMMHVLGFSHLYVNHYVIINYMLTLLFLKKGKTKRQERTKDNVFSLPRVFRLDSLSKY